ncbi:MAG: hypothetical protein H6740_03665 [Alphaproteobacteria bacterium]|nr:hypothetical protein [Alphaproteobacteria bacterium]
MPHAWESFKAAFGAPPPEKHKWYVRAEAMAKTLGEAVEAVGALGLVGLDAALEEAGELLLKLTQGMNLYDTGTPKEQKTAVSALERRCGRAEKTHKKLRKALRDGATPGDIMAQPGGAHLLDLMVEDISWSRAKTADKDWTIAAIQARFNIPELVTPRDKHEKKALPGLYRALRMVPESHVLENDSLLSYVQRARPEAGDGRFSGVYYTDDQRIVTHLDQILTGKNDNDYDREVPKAIRPTGRMKDFTHTTLHEVGHAVDDKNDIMGEDNPAERAGWRNENLESAARAIGAEHNFFTDFPDLPDAWLLLVLTQYITTGSVDPGNFATDLNAKKAHAPNLPPLEVLLQLPALLACEQARVEREVWPDNESDKRSLSAGAFNYFTRAKEEAANAGYGEPAQQRACHFLLKNVTQQVYGFNVPLAQILSDEHAAMQGLIGVDTELIPWDRIDAHAASKIMIRLHNEGYKDKQGYYNAGRSGALAAQVGDRTYTVCNNQLWWSYLFIKRNQGVSEYQFNAPAEWFSELYALYYGGKLPEGHPDYALLAHYDH